MAKPDFEKLSRREREVMYVVHRQNQVSAEQLQEELSSDISYSGARRYLSILEEKGFLTMEKQGKRYYYTPVDDTTELGISMLKKAFGSFFNGSPVMGIANFVQREGRDLDNRELAYLDKLIQDAKDKSKQ